MAYESLSNIRWSEESLKLKDFVLKYNLPQIVCVDKGDYGSNGNDTFSFGQKLKLHSVTSEFIAICYDTNNAPHEIFLPCQEPVEVFIREKSRHCTSVADITKLSVRPDYVITQSAISIPIGEGRNSLHIRKTEKLRVMFRTEETSQSHQQKHCLIFGNETGDMFELPFNCKAGFQPIYLKETCLLNQILPRYATRFKRSVYFKFINSQFCYYQLGILKCKEVQTRKYIVVSSTKQSFDYVFRIPVEAEMTVKVAEGTTKHDSEYENIRRNYHNIKEIEDEVKKSCINEMIQIFSHHQENTDSCFDKRLLPGMIATLTPFGYGKNPVGQSHSVPAAKPREKQQKGIYITKSENTYTPLINPTSTGGSLMNENEFLSPVHPTSLMATQKHDQNSHKRLAPAEDINMRKSYNAATNNPPLHSPQRRIPRTGVQKIFTPVMSYTSPRESLHSKAKHPSFVMENKKVSKGDHRTFTPLEEASVKQVCVALKRLNLEKHVETFKKNLIDGRLLFNLTEDDFKAIGLNSLEIRKIQSLRNGWLPKVS